MDIKKERSPARRYLAALAAPALLAGVIQVTWPFFEHSPVSLFFLAVIFSAWYGGLIPGLLSAVFSFVLDVFFFVPPYLQFWPNKQDFAPRLFTFAIISPFICLICELMRREKGRVQLALNASRASEERYRKLAENFPNGAVITYDRDLRVTFIAGRDLPESGITAEFLIGKSLDEIVPPEVAVIVKPHFQAAFAGHTEIYECPFPDGRIYFAAVAPLFDTSGQANEILVICQNITERKTAEAKLKQSESLLAEAQQQAQLGSWTRNLETNEVAWSDQLFRLFDMEPQQAGTTYEAFLDRVHPEDRARVEALALEAIRSQQSCEFEYRIIRPDGTAGVHHERIFVTLNEDGKTVRLFGTTQDITERKQANQALREAESRYRNIFEHAVEGIFQTSPDGRFVVANPALANMFGFDSPEELISERADISKQHYVDPKQRTKFKRRLEQAGVVYNFEYEAYRKDGGKIWVSDNVRAVCDEDGQVLCYEGTATDITERKRAEEALRASEERYRELFESARDAIYVHDLEGKYVSVNRAAEKLSGYSRDEIIGKHFSDFVVPEQVDDVRKEMTRKLVTHQGARYTAEIIARDGRRVPVEVNSNLIYEAGLPVGVQGLVRDITERRHAEQAIRQAEERYRGIFENAGEGIFQSTPEGRFLVANPALARIHGYESPEELISTFTDIPTQVYVDAKRRAEFRNLLAQHGVVRGFEHQVFRKDGSKIWISVNARAVRDEQGQLLYYEGTAQDITEGKVAADRLKEYEKVVEGLEEMILVVDRDYRYLLANRAFLNYRGLGKEQLLGQLTAQVLDKEVFETIVKGRLAECFQGKVVKYEMRYPYPGLGERDLFITYLPIEGSNGIDKAACVLQDITEQKRAEQALRQSEERFSKAFHSSPAALSVSLLEDGRLLEVNDAFLCMTGYERHEVIGRSTADIGLWVDTSARITMAGLVRERGAVKDLEIDFRRKSGEVRNALLSVDLIELSGKPCVLGTGQDVTERKRAEQALRNYPRRLISAQEAERKNIARELHDQIGQVLTAIRLNLQNIREVCETSESRMLIDEAMDMTDQAMDEVRDLSFELRPSLLDDLGLVAALRWYTDRFAKRTAIPTTIVTSIPDGVRLRRELETACFRITQEALTNVARHSKAKNVWVDLKAIKGETVLSVKDDGNGFDPYSVNPRSFPIGLGLRGMEERALALGGRLEVKSDLRKGTELRAYFPNGMGKGDD